MSKAIGIDLGGTKIEIIALGEDGTELIRRRRPAPRDDYRATIEAIAGLIAGVEAELGETCTVGIGHPGAISPATGRLKNCNSTWLNGQSFDADMEKRLGRRIAFANDANCLGLSEATDGAGAGAAVVFTVILGTGVGGAIVMNGRVLSGANAIGGEWGHNPLPWPKDDERPGPDCYCGLRGCIETWLSGGGLASEHQRRTGEAIQAPEIIARADAGDPHAEATLQIYEDRLARGLASIINVIDPDVIVLGGGVSNVQRLYENVPRLWSRYAFSDQVATQLKPPMHGDSSGVRGAAWLGRSHPPTN